MTETHTSPPTHTLLIKILVIIGFAVTIVVIVWLSIQGIKRLPNAFSSLASMAESIQTYRTTQKTTPPSTTSSSTPNEYAREEEDTATPTNTQSTEDQNLDTETTNSIQTVPVPEEPKYTPPPKTTTIHPYSNPNGYVDLSVITLGSGALRHGTFVLTPRYDTNTRNAIQFTIKNIGTKTSGTWGFETVLPSGNVYESEPQFPLNPQEQVTFTLGFDLEDSREDFVEIRNTVMSTEDTRRQNNSSVWTVAVRD